MHKIVDASSFVSAIKEDRTLRDIWTEGDLDKALTQDNEAVPDKKLPAAERLELEE